jgi:hypothetical protein
MSGKVIAMLMEPRAINPTIYDFIEQNYNNFYLVYTYDSKLLNIGGNIRFYPHCGCWIKPEDQLIYEKNKLVSIVASNKRQTIGHNLRHWSIESAKKNNLNLDVFGRGYSEIKYKLTAFKDYAFSIVIENSKTDFYFTEKLIDSFVTGTVPIYWGCPSITEYFDINGMIIFDDLNSLLYELEGLSLDRYNDMLPSINKNFEIAKEYLIAEDWLYNNTEIFK